MRPTSTSNKSRSVGTKMILIVVATLAILVANFYFPQRITADTYPFVRGIGHDETTTLPLERLRYRIPRYIRTYGRPFSPEFGIYRDPHITVSHPKSYTFSLVEQTVSFEIQKFRINKGFADRNLEENLLAIRQSGQIYEYHLDADSIPHYFPGGFVWVVGASSDAIYVLGLADEEGFPQFLYEIYAISLPFTSENFQTARQNDGKKWNALVRKVIEAGISAETRDVLCSKGGPPTRAFMSDVFDVTC